MKKNAAILAMFLAVPATSQADLLFTIGAKASVWDAEPSGQFDDDVSADSKENGLGLESNTGNQYEVFIDHPVPLIPDLRLAQTAIDFSGEGRVVVAGGFGEEALAGDVSSFLDISHSDVTLMWGLPIPTPFFDVNFGLTARTFDGELIVTEKQLLQRTERTDIDVTIPLLFGRAKLETPLGFYGEADIQHVSYDGNDLTDIKDLVGFDIPVPLPTIDLAIEAGYRSLDLKTDKESTDIETDFKVDGTYYGLSLSVGL